MKTEERTIKIITIEDTDTLLEDMGLELGQTCFVCPRGLDCFHEMSVSPYLGEYMKWEDTDGELWKIVPGDRFFIRPEVEPITQILGQFKAQFNPAN